MKACALMRIVRIWIIEIVLKFNELEARTFAMHSRFLHKAEITTSTGMNQRNATVKQTL